MLASSVDGLIGILAGWGAQTMGVPRRLGSNGMGLKQSGGSERNARTTEPAERPGNTDQCAWLRAHSLRTGGTKDGQNQNIVDVGQGSWTLAV